ncbi:uncharacterized protein LOC126368745 [Pectinophora gossypiella]|uniref:uncharacterized protein LOC126368745 n=1 Tax=Pectinophora gossypiella TaxID=13191 RepID=UPI00214E5883|nr:uncharacterized protein LOC126368745 [Pectinophora gossypiella]
MKLPFNIIIAPMIKPYLGRTRSFCEQLAFSFSIPYTYIYSTLGIFISANHLRRHLGEGLAPALLEASDDAVERDCMLVHDLRIIATSMGLVQYICLLAGCYTLNGINESPEGVRMRLRALLVALLGISMSACAFASQPVELELDDDEVTQKLNNVSFARRITKPTIRLVMGYGKFSAFVTATTSLLLLIAVMSKQAWWRRGVRWLAAPALLVAALEAASDASDAMIAAVLRGSTDPARVLLQTVAAALLVTVEILIWYFIAKFFEYNPPITPDDREKKTLIEPVPQ